MDKENIKNELQAISRWVDNSLQYVSEMIDSQNEQKNKKTEKMLDFTRCAFKALYATKKYGCSGFGGDAGCLVCEYRK